MQTIALSSAPQRSAHLRGSEGRSRLALTAADMHSGSGCGSCCHRHRHRITNACSLHSTESTRAAAYGLLQSTKRAGYLWTRYLPAHDDNSTRRSCTKLHLLASNDCKSWTQAPSVSRSARGLHASAFAPQRPVSPPSGHARGYERSSNGGVQRWASAWAGQLAESGCSKCVRPTTPRLGVVGHHHRIIIINLNPLLCSLTLSLQVSRLRWTDYS